MPIFNPLSEEDASEITCCICLCVWTDPQELLPCRHILCRGCCATTARKNNSKYQECPMCRVRVRRTAEPNRVLINIAANVKMICADCGWVGPHSETCNHVCRHSASQTGKTTGSAATPSKHDDDDDDDGDGPTSTTTTKPEVALLHALAVATQQQHQNQQQQTTSPALTAAPPRPTAAAAAPAAHLDHNSTATASEGTVLAVVRGRLREKERLRHGLEEHRRLNGELDRIRGAIKEEERRRHNEEMDAARGARNEEKQQLREQRELIRNQARAMRVVERVENNPRRRKQGKLISNNNSANGNDDDDGDQQQEMPPSSLPSSNFSSATTTGVAPAASADGTTTTITNTTAVADAATVEVCGEALNTPTVIDRERMARERRRVLRETATAARQAERRAASIIQRRRREQHQQQQQQQQQQQATEQEQNEKPCSATSEVETYVNHRTRTRKDTSATSPIGRLDMTANLNGVTPYWVC